ncbi:MAG: M24 family metallopeptidase, partial [Pseudomonadota bacterium]
CADGYMVIWDYKNAPFLSAHNPLVSEVRSGASLFYFSTGDLYEQKARKFAREVQDLLRAHSDNRQKLAIDKIAIDGVYALQALGITIHNGEELCEKARSIKGPDEILAMRCASDACEKSVAAMQEASIPGLSENEIWAVLHAENVKRGGEWIETRLLSTGPRTSPWFQECGQRILQNNEILAFDTDLVGCYGICVDISRTWWIGDRAPRDDMIIAMQHAVQHITENMALLRPGTSFHDLTFKGHQLDAQYNRHKYSVRMHGVGLCDEWPSIPYADHWEEGAVDYQVEAGMVFCVEALVTPENGDFSIKLEDQVLVSETGYENLTKYPFDDVLIGR